MSLNLEQEDWGCQEVHIKGAIGVHRIYVYSSTGNSLALAEGLARRLPPAELINMASFREGDVTIAGERVGFVFPVHAFGLPAVVRSFFSRAEVGPGSSVYLLLNSAGLPLGAPALAENLLVDRDIHVQAVFHVAMAGNFPPLSNPPAGEKSRSLADRGERALDDIAETLRHGKRPTTPGKGWRLLSEAISRRAFRGTAAEDRRFFASEGCDGCSLCAQVCPVANIVLADGRPQWQHRCTGCFACFHWCPNKAIQYNRSSSKTRNRYHHPDVSRQRYLQWCRQDSLSEFQERE